MLLVTCAARCSSIDLHYPRRSALIYPHIVPAATLPVSCTARFPTVDLHYPR
jgi:hypothetical protein